MRYWILTLGSIFCLLTFHTEDWLYYRIFTPVNHLFNYPLPRSWISDYTHIILLGAIPHTCLSIHGSLPIPGQASTRVYPYMAKRSCEFNHTWPSIHGSLNIHSQAFMGVYPYMAKHSWEFNHTRPVIHGSFSKPPINLSHEWVIVPIINYQRHFSLHTWTFMLESDGDLHCICRWQPALYP